MTAAPGGLTAVEIATGIVIGDGADPGPLPAVPARRDPAFDARASLPAGATSADAVASASPAGATRRSCSQRRPASPAVRAYRSRFRSRTAFRRPDPLTSRTGRSSWCATSGSMTGSGSTTPTHSTSSVRWRNRCWRVTGFCGRSTPTSTCRCSRRPRGARFSQASAATSSSGAPAGRAPRRCCS